MAPERFEALAKLQWERPRFDHHFTIEHFGLSTPEQIRRLARIGGLVSANVYYVYELADAYWRHSIGHERATRMARLATVVREGIPLALHSDFTMAPAQPLNHAWVAVNRIGDSGEVAGPEERLTLGQALRAITIDAAFVLGMEDEIGSVRAGKRADFTVREADPFEEPAPPHVTSALGLNDRSVIDLIGVQGEVDYYPFARLRFRDTTSTRSPTSRCRTRR